jgi:hypothetical protein
MESKFDVLGVARKLVKYIVQFSKKRKKKKSNTLFIGCPNNK